MRAIALALGLLCLPAAGAAEVELLTHSSGLQYGRVVPTACVAARCPVLLVLPPGAQNRHLMKAGLRPWLARFEAGRWIVISPVAPDRARRFYTPEGVAALGPLLDEIAAQYAVAGGRLPVFGMSNGGLSAFTLATHRPDRVARIFAAPGFARTAALARIDAMRDIPAEIMVGAKDGDWRAAAAETAAALQTVGGKVGLEVLPDAGHNLLSRVTWARLSAWLASARVP